MPSFAPQTPGRAAYACMLALLLALLALAVRAPSAVARTHAPTAQAGATMGGAGADSVSLIMFYEMGCEYCERWEEEVGVIYSKTPEGRFAPLTRIDISDVDDTGIKQVVFTPTFIVLRGKKEVGRIVGYPGEDFFWDLLGDILGKLGYMPGNKQSQK